MICDVIDSAVFLCFCLHDANHHHVKLIALLDICDELGVDTAPAEVAEGVFVVPLFSWYSSTFDEADPRPGGAMMMDMAISIDLPPYIVLLLMMMMLLLLLMMMMMMMLMTMMMMMMMVMMVMMMMMMMTMMLLLLLMMMMMVVVVMMMI